MKMAMQPFVLEQMLVAALLPGTYIWLKTGSTATEWEPAAVAGLASSPMVSGLWSTTPSIGAAVGGLPMIAGHDLDWSEQMAGAKPTGCVPVAATDPLYILYTSGTTGMPKGIVRDNGGHLVALKWSMR